MKKKNIELTFIILIFIVIFILIINTDTIAKYKNSGSLIINEIVSNNKNSLIDKDGNSYDYIEIYNGYDYDINLSDYYLSDDSLNLRKWQFPNVVIKANDYYLVYASGLDKYEEDIVHTNFKLSKTGEVITLSNYNANYISRVYYEETMEDTSYGYNGSEYVYFYNPTPNSVNDLLYSDKPIKDNEISNIDLRINEYMTDNNNGYSMIEIYNNSDSLVNMEGYYLSDNIDNKYKYTFPNIEIDKNSYLIIYTSGLDKYITSLLLFILSPYTT